MSASPLRVAVVGATGYTGAELVRILATHPRAQVVAATSERSAGKPLSAECPWLASDLILQSLDEGLPDCDFVFLCQEAGFAMNRAPELLERARVIDLSADFRLEDLSIYEEYYRRAHACPAWNEAAVYGLPELVSRDSIRAARLVANPGCYPTASLLGLMPIVHKGWLNGTPVVDAKSGVSGAGRSRQETEYLFTEVTGSFRGYKPIGHRHTPEIEQRVGRPIRFTPQLLPIARGLQATIHAPLAEGVDETALRAAYEERYADEPFVRLCEHPPSVKATQGSNACLISVHFDPRTRYAVVCSAIDNLMKGASGQAVQNMNLMAGLPETEGLPAHGVWP